MNTCQAADCSKTFERRGRSRQIYCSLKCKCRVASRRHQQTPQYKAYQKEYQKEYCQTPERKAYMKAYRQTDKYKAYQRKNPRNRKLRKHAAFLAQRDGHLCMLCRRPLDYRTDPFHIDHIVPRSRGGSDDRANLCLSCPSCNLRKSNRLPDPFNCEQAAFDFPLQLEFPLCAS